MKLSNLSTGEEAIVVEVIGNEGVKNRIKEMGFVVGQKIKAIKSAPLRDPVEYDIMGYKITIRRNEANNIIVTQNKFKNESVRNSIDILKNNYNVDDENTEDYSKKSIYIALVGNPNCGKTTIFNHATSSKERVANYSGVTVYAKESILKMDGYTLHVVDLPGTYSLTSYSPEEMFVVDYLISNPPDIIINVLDAGNLERNLFLTTQIIDYRFKTIVALNMYDEFKKQEGELNHEKLSELLGIPFIPTVGTTGRGIEKLFKTVIQVFNNEDKISRKIQISYGIEIQNAIDKVSTFVKSLNELNLHSYTFISLQLLEGDKSVLSYFSSENIIKIEKLCKYERDKIEKDIGRDLKTEIIHNRYGFIHGALSKKYKRKNEKYSNKSQKIDKTLTNKFLGIPVFFLIIWFIFYATFKLGEYPINLINNGISWLAGVIYNLIPVGIFQNLVVDGIIGGVGGIIVFLPNIVILFFLISLLEDSGYLARTAFIMDKIMHKVGLHGKSFIPLLMGFGCNVPAVMATRIIESKRDRLVTMFIIPFMSCSARLPVYVLFISAFFPKNESFILFSMYGIGVLIALITAIFLNKTIFNKTESPFVMELPPYRMPTAKAVIKHTWYKTLHFLKKMGNVILFASIIIWALGYFPRDQKIIDKYVNKIKIEQQFIENTKDTIAIENANQKIDSAQMNLQAKLLEQSWISRIGKAIQPIFDPLGFDWKMSVSILTGVLAKEVVVSSMGILYNAGSDVDETSITLVKKLQFSQQKNDTPLIAYFSFLVFILLYFPCVGTLVAIRKETEKVKWMLFAAIYPLLFSWIFTMLIYQIGSRF